MVVCSYKRGRMCGNPTPCSASPPFYYIFTEPNRKDRNTMNYAAAKQLVKHNGPAKYRGTKLIVLTKLTDGLFRGKEDTRDIEGREVKKRTDTVLGWVRLKNPTYLMDVLREIEEIKAERHGRYLKYTIDLSPLQKLEPLDLAKNVEEFKKKDAERARLAYAKKRKEKEEAERKRIVRNFLRTVAARKADTKDTQSFVNSLLQEVKQ